MTHTTYFAHVGDDRVPIDSPRDAEYLTREYDVRVTAVTEGL